MMFSLLYVGVSCESWTTTFFEAFQVFLEIYLALDINMILISDGNAEHVAPA